MKFKLKEGKTLIEIDLSAEIADNNFELLQAKIFSLTDIPPKNLKLLYKGKLLKDIPSLTAVPDGSELLVMGTKTHKEIDLNKLAEAAKEAPPTEEAIKPIIRYGYVNIGNTCYMNAGLQFLKSVPELVDFLLKQFPANQYSPDAFLMKGFIGLLKDEEVNIGLVKMFVVFFLQEHHEFEPFGTQQDAQEFVQKLLHYIERQSPQHREQVRKFFEIQFVDTVKNLDIPQEPLEVNNHSELKLSCSLGSVQVKVGTIGDGIKLSLETTMEKNSQLDGLNHRYSKTTRFGSLPNYLQVQMVRFFWKQAEDLPTAKAQAVKICKAVDFGAKLDLFDYCTPELKEKLSQGRALLEESRLNEQVRYKKEYEAYKKSLGDTNRPETLLLTEFKLRWRRNYRSTKVGLETGMYQLIGVITHEGQSVQSGHYRSWVRENLDEWTKYDDDCVYQVPEEKVYHLRGGQPNLQIAYMLMFRKVLVPEPVKPSAQQNPPTAQ